MGEVSFAISFDFEATSGKKTYNLDQDTNLYPVSYNMGIPFHQNQILIKFLSLQVLIRHFTSLTTLVI